MANKARDYKRTTIRRLDTLSGNQCAEPNCTKQLIAEDKVTIISKICHIEAASANGPRYNPAMTDDERRHYKNLILLCDEHHGIIDNKENEDKYPVELLAHWKENHESKFLYSKLSNRPSLLKHAIRAISNVDFNDSDNRKKTFNAFSIDEKISYNGIERNKALIDEYKVFHSKINALYTELEIQGSPLKERLLRNIRTIYIRTKGKYIGTSANPIEIIQKNADNIIEDIENELLDLIELDDETYEEDISFGISIIMVDAFMRCKILEEPKHDN